MEFIYNDGGRSMYFKADNVGDCCSRAICNATGKDYKEVYSRLKELTELEVQRLERKSNSKNLSHWKQYRNSLKAAAMKKANVRNGTAWKVVDKYLKEIGWVRHSLKSGQMHFTADELPEGNLIVKLSKHLTNVKDKIIYDTYDCSKKVFYDRYTGDKVVNERRVVYTYWTEK